MRVPPTNQGFPAPSLQTIREETAHDLQLAAQDVGIESNPTQGPGNATGHPGMPASAPMPPMPPMPESGRLTEQQAALYEIFHALRLSTANVVSGTTSAAAPEQPTPVIVTPSSQSVVPRSLVSAFNQSTSVSGEESRSAGSAGSELHTRMTIDIGHPPSEAHMKTMKEKLDKEWQEKVKTDPHAQKTVPAEMNWLLEQSQALRASGVTLTGVSAALGMDKPTSPGPVSVDRKV